MNKDNVFFDFVNPKFYPEFVYFLGFMWADGSIDNSGYHNKISIEIKTEDADDLSRIFNKVGKWQIYKRKRDIKINGKSINSKETTRFRLSNKNLVNLLISLGYKNKSGSYDKIFKILPNDMHIYWIRGLIDGDGSFLYKNKKTNATYSALRLTISGPIEQNWDTLKNYCFNKGISYRVINQKAKKYSGSSFVIYKFKHVNKFISILFEKRDEIWLKRKFEKALLILSY